MTPNDAAVTTEATTAQRILVLTPQFPYPPHQGTTIRNYNLVAGLAQRHEVHLLSFGDPAESRGTLLDDLCQTVQVIRPPQRAMRQRLMGLVLSRSPDMAQRLPSAQFRAALAATLDRANPDVVEVEGIELAQYLFQAAAHRGQRARPLLVFDDHNAEYVLQQRAFETDLGNPRPFGTAQGKRWIAAAYSFVQWRRLRRYERRACLAADRVVAVSQTDAEALRRLVPGLAPAVVPNGVDMAFYTAEVPSLDEGPDQRDLVFTGKMDFRPNVDAVLWFAQEVLPLIRREAPETRFWVVGKDPHPRLESLGGAAPHEDNDSGIVLTGWVEDIRPYIAGAGVKVLEAMAMGRAIVSTSLGCEGFDLVPGQELIVADTPAEFAATVLALFRDPDRRERLGRAARRFAGARYDWRTIVPRLERVYEA